MDFLGYSAFAVRYSSLRSFGGRNCLDGENSSGWELDAEEFEGVRLWVRYWAGAGR